MPEHDRQGTGKHPHKDSKEPYLHHGFGGDERQSSGSSNAGGTSQGGSSFSKENLKQREYRDNNGEVHHHTHTFEEQHK